MNSLQIVTLMACTTLVAAYPSKYISAGCKGSGKCHVPEGVSVMGKAAQKGGGVLFSPPLVGNTYQPGVTYTISANEDGRTLVSATKGSFTKVECNCMDSVGSTSGQWTAPAAGAGSVTVGITKAGFFGSRVSTSVITINPRNKTETTLPPTPLPTAVPSTSSMSPTTSPTVLITPSTSPQTSAPTPMPTKEPSEQGKTAKPTPKPTSMPTAKLTQNPTSKPTSVPTILKNTTTYATTTPNSNSQSTQPPNTTSSVSNTTVSPSNTTAADTANNANGPNGEGCNGNGTKIDEVEFDNDFTCDCNPTFNVTASANCDVLNSPPSSSTNTKDSSSTLPTWGIVVVVLVVLAFVVVIAVVVVKVAKKRVDDGPKRIHFQNPTYDDSSEI